jgi:hypothetical protein
MMEILSKPTVMSVIHFFCAGLVQSFCYMNNRLPEERRSPAYPPEPGKRAMLNIAWMFQLGFAVVMSLSQGIVYLLVALAIYFILLPFVFQIPMARMLGFRNIREYIETVDAIKK